MRIITGKLKGRKIPVPKTDLLRPTTDRTKEGIFSVMAARRYFESTTVLDLFAGSGNLGFEALSRGSESVLFVDKEQEHIKHVEKIAESFGVEDQISTRIMAVEEYLENPGQSFDFVFADPPYDYFFMNGIIDLVLERDVLNEDGWFILEHDKRHDFSDHPNCVYSRAYGRTIVAIFKNNTDDF
jgi:16S rRNA (guanine(966)-N(2))-methyltransferase RsmD